MDSYNLESITKHLPDGFPWKNRIHFFDSVDSTNNMAKKWAKEGIPGGTILIADHQTGGRGRLGRSFSSPAGAGIYMTVVLRPCCPPDQLMHLTCAAAVAACRAVEESTGISVKVKWTNDLVCGTKKLSGILTELVLSSDAHLAEYAIIGIGINCGQNLSDFPEELQDKACSIRMLTDTVPDRSKIAAALIQHFEEMDRILLSGTEEILEEYRSLCMTLGKEVSVVRGSEVYHGTALNVDPQGGLILQLPNGCIETVTSGEVSVRGMYGYI